VSTGNVVDCVQWRVAVIYFMYDGWSATQDIFGLYCEGVIKIA